MKVISASDSFKGCLSSAEVNAAVERGVLAAVPDAKVLCISISDGGEGFLGAFRNLSIGRCRVPGPMGDPVEARYGILPDGTAVVESAEAVGLGLVPREKRNPLVASSRGLGELLVAIAAAGCRKFIVGLGGSATSDGGIGMLEGLGWKFSDGPDWNGSGVPEWVHESEFTIASDVRSPLCGPDGAALLFSRQKGATVRDSFILEERMKRFGEVVRRKTGFDMQTPGCGAAGGLGGAFMAFLHGKMRSGIDLVLDADGFDGELKDTDLVITGEGRIDSQTLKGKAPAGILRRAGNVPVAAVCGRVAEGIRPERSFCHVMAVSPEGEPMEISMDPDITSRRISEAVSIYLQPGCRNLSGNLPPKKKQ